MNRVAAGRATYGHRVGIIMQHDGLVRLPGDVGNLTTFAFPVTYRAVPDFPMRAMKTLALREYSDLFVEAARDLEAQGCQAIAAGCGFLALLQPVLAAAVHVPVFTSSLIQVPLVHASLAKGQRVGIITASRKDLTEEHFNAVGWSSCQIPIAMIGIDDDPETEFDAAHFALAAEDPAVFHRIEASMVRLAKMLLDRSPDIGALVFECTNMPPYAATVQRATGCPVFDIVTLIDMVHESVTRVLYRGYC